MTVRIFNGITYPVPGVETAIKTLRPGAKWEIYNTHFIKWEDPEQREPPTWEEIQEEIKKEEEIYNYYLYERQRSDEYPDWKEQFDMLYHDIKSNNLNDGIWVKFISQIKEKYPKSIS